MKGLCKLALAVAFVAACGGDGAITEPSSPNATPSSGGILAIGVDAVTGATIETNGNDYLPGEIVHVVGHGWTPGETVNLHMTEEPHTHADVDSNVVADSAGAFSIHYYDVTVHDLGVTFTLTATGGTSGSKAIAIFTDGSVTSAPLTVKNNGTPSCGTGNTVFNLGDVVCVSTTIVVTPSGGGAGELLGGFKIQWLDPDGEIFATDRYEDKLNGFATEARQTPDAGGVWTVRSCKGDTGDGCGQGILLDSKTFTINGSVSTTTTLGASPASPTVYGQSVTFTADVDPSVAGPDPQGTVTFYDFAGVIDCGAPGGTLLGSDNTVPFTHTTTTLSVASHRIWACYDANTGWTDSQDDISHPVNQASVDVVVSAIPTSPTNVGNPVTFTATVTAASPGSGTPTGTVTFFDGACGTTQIGNTQTLPANQVTTSALAAGSHTITACYSGDGNFNSNSGSTTHSISLLATVTQLVASASPSVTGQPVTFTATVTHNGSAIGANGTVEFRRAGSGCSNGIVFATVSLNASGQATSPSQSFNAVNLGTTIAACYSGTATYGSSFRIINHFIQKANTTQTATDSDDPSAFGQSITLGTTVTVDAPGAGLPTGNVRFWELTNGDCVNPVGTQLGATQTLSGAGTASVNYSDFSVGNHTITVCYEGDPNYNGSSSATTHQVNKAQPTITLTTNGPVYFGTTSTFTATIGVPFSGVPTGTVRFYDGATCDLNTGIGSLGVFLGSGDIGDAIAGKALFSSAALNAATYDVIACYGGDGNFLGATDSESHVVNKATTSLVLATNDNEVEFGDPVTFTATVTVINGVASTNGGNVKFAIGGTCDVSTGDITGGTALSTAQDDLSSGTAAVTVSDLPVGTNQTITACYGGNSNIVGSGDTETQSVTKKTTILALTVTPGAQQYSDNTVFDVAITPAEVNGSPLTGDVYFYVNGPAQACGTSLPAPSGSVGNVAIANADDGVKSFTYAIDKQASTTAYVVTACFYSSNTNFKNSSNTGSLTVNVEEAVVFNESVSPGNISISNTGGTLTFSIKEKNPETNAGKFATAGDLTKIGTSTVVVTANGVLNPSNQITFTCSRSFSGTALQYTHVINYSCTFPAVTTADTYDVGIDITGNYYDGAGAALIQVTDPAAGFTTGGGWYWHNGVVGGEKVNFGFMAKATVNNKKTNYQGSLLVIRHKTNGDIIKVKSNVFEGYSIGTTVSNCTPASFSGKATYAVNGVSAGNFAFIGYGVDCGEPGTSDKFGLYHAHTPALNYEIATSTTAAGVSGATSLKTIIGGNIQVPQPSGGGRP
jgi:hypothetical protein